MTVTMAELDPEDAALLERLRSIAEVVDPVPEHVAELGKAAFAFRRPDEELMHLVTLDRELTAMRASATSRLHVFELEDLSLDVEVSVRGTFRTVVGAVSDPLGVGAVTVTVETPSATFTTTADQDGRFEVGKVPIGNLRIRIERADGRTVRTPWLRDD